MTDQSSEDSGRIGKEDKIGPPTSLSWARENEGGKWGWQAFVAVSLVTGAGLLLFADSIVRVLIIMLYAVILAWIHLLTRQERFQGHGLPRTLCSSAAIIVIALIIGTIAATLIADIARIILTCALVGLLAAALIIYWFSAYPERTIRRRPNRQFWIILACFGVLALVAIAVGLAASLRASPDELEKSLLLGFSASLIEDLVFFSLLGLFVVLIQRREADLSRTMDDRIELLFNAKRLRSGEAAYLREQVRSISNDCRESSTFIDVIAYDPKKKLVQIDVGRRYYVANYLADESSRYELKIDLTADSGIGKSPAITIFPTLSTKVQKENGEWKQLGDTQTLDEGGVIEDGQSYRETKKHLDIATNETREFRTRFRGWQRLYAEGTKPQDEQFESYEVTLLKHWDMINIHVRNSLQRELRVTMSGDDSRSFTLVAGDDERKAYRTENLLANSIIAIRFMPV
jgi:hypothetical protein